jgi:hypothetical protein
MTSALRFYYSDIATGYRYASTLNGWRRALLNYRFLLTGFVVSATSNRGRVRNETDVRLLDNVGPNASQRFKVELNGPSEKERNDCFSQNVLLLHANQAHTSPQEAYSDHNVVLLTSCDLPLSIFLVHNPASQR